MTKDELSTTVDGALSGYVRSGQKLEQRILELEAALVSLTHPHTGHLAHPPDACTGECEEVRRVLTSNAGESYAAAISIASEEGRGEGFEKAREMAAAICEDMTDSVFESSPGAERIRAMQDERAGDAEEVSPPVCECGHGEGWHHYGKKQGCMKKIPEQANVTCPCRAWRPVVSP
jgi:hypothetical protein